MYKQNPFQTSLFVVGLHLLLGSCTSKMDSMGEGVLAKVDNIAILREDFVKMVQFQNIKSSPNALNRRMLLDSMIAQKILVRWASKAELPKGIHLEKLTAIQRELFLADIGRRSLVRNLPGSESLRTYMNGIPYALQKNAMKGPAELKEYNDAITTYRIQQQFIQSEVAKARANAKIEINAAALDAIPAETLLPTSTPATPNTK